MVRAPRDPDAGDGVSDGSTASQDETELDRLRNLARKLARVPEREIDAEQAKEGERKEASRGRERHSYGSTPRR
jgi:hypothetical protein